MMWEKILPYAAAFGISKKIIKALKLEFGDEIVNTPIIGYYAFGLNSYSPSSNFAISAASGTSSSSSSGSSGGFGGGYGGGTF